MTAWLRPDLSVESADSRESDYLRILEFQHMNLDLECLPQLLNAFNDGTLLVTGSGYESFGISLVRYTPQGLQEIGVSYSYGC